MSTEHYLPPAAAIRASIERRTSPGYSNLPSMSRAVQSSACVGFPLAAPLSARADHPVADAPDRPDTKLVVVVAEPDGDDVSGMEHGFIMQPSDWIATSDGGCWYLPNMHPALWLPRTEPWTREQLDAELSRASLRRLWQRLPE